MLKTNILDTQLLNKYSAEALDLTVKLAGINSHTKNLDGIKKIIDIITPILEDLGFTTEVKNERNLIGRHFGETSPSVIMLGHMDTVFPEDSPFKEITIENGLLRGPGVSDMKGGIALMISFLKYLKETGSLTGHNICVLLNSDEETGSELSRDLIRTQARDYDLALIFEGGNHTEDNNFTYLNTRLGFAAANFVITGHTASLFFNPKDGVNAIEEMSHKVAEISKIKKSFPGVYLNITSNIQTSPAEKGKIPDFASFTVEIRYSDSDQLTQFMNELEKISNTNYISSSEGIKPQSVLNFTHGRPPMTPCQKTLAMCSTFEECAQEMNYNLINKTRSGGSDGCYTSDTKTPTIDGVGPVGGGWHTDGEYLEIDSFKTRLELLARFWQKL